MLVPDVIGDPGREPNPLHPSRSQSLRSRYRPHLRSAERNPRTRLWLVCKGDPQARKELRSMAPIRNDRPHLPAHIRIANDPLVVPTHKGQPS
jgi:hypothetical protein